MSGFLENAMRIFETATAAPADGGAQNLSIVMEANGAVRIVDGDGWHPEALRTHYGARAAYQVTHGPRGVEIRGHSLGRTCHLQSDRPQPDLLRALDSAPRYTVICPPQLQ